MSQYYRYYDRNGNSVYMEIVTLAGTHQEHSLPRGAVELDRDTYLDAMDRIGRAQRATEQDLDRFGRTPPEPPVDSEGE